MDAAEVVDENDAVELLLLLLGLMYGENMEWIDNADCAPVEVEVSSAAPPPLLLRGRLRRLVCCVPFGRRKLK